MTEISSLNYNNTGNAPILVIGVGNPILSDDGVGIHIVREIEKKYSGNSKIDFDEVSIGGLSLVERFIGYEKVIMIDGLALQGGTPGDVYKFSIDDFRTTIHTYCAHDCNLATAYDLLKSELGEEKLPKDITIIGIEVETIDQFSESLTKTVQDAVPEAITIIEQELEKILN